MNLVGALNTIAAQYTDGKHVARIRHIGYSNQTETITNTSKITQTTAPWTKYTDNSSWAGCDTSSYLCGTDEALGAGDRGFTTDYQLVNGVYGSMAAKTPGGSSSNYWLASRYYEYSYYEYKCNVNWIFCGRYVYGIGFIRNTSIYNGTAGYSYAVRPIVTLSASSSALSGVGTSSSPRILD